MQSKGEGERKKGIERAKEYDRGEGWRGGHAREEREREKVGSKHWNGMHARCIR